MMLQVFFAYYIEYFVNETYLSKARKFTIYVARHQWMINSDSEELGFMADFMTNSLGKTKKKTRRRRRRKQQQKP